MRLYVVNSPIELWLLKVTVHLLKNQVSLIVLGTSLLDYSSCRMVCSMKPFPHVHCPKLVLATVLVFFEVFFLHQISSLHCKHAQGLAQGLRISTHVHKQEVPDE